MWSLYYGVLVIWLEEAFFIDGVDRCRSKIKASRCVFHTISEEVTHLTSCGVEHYWLSVFLAAARVQLQINPHASFKCKVVTIRREIAQEGNSFFSNYIGDSKYSHAQDKTLDGDVKN